MKTLLAFAAALAGFIAGPAAAKEAADLIVRDATLIDVAGGQAVPHRSIAVKGDTIVAVGAPGEIDRSYAAARSIDAHGRFVMPGLWDMHVHFGGGPELIGENKALLPVYVAYGITAVRDCAADISDAVLLWRDQVAKGALLGPTIFTSGPKLEGYKPIWKGTIEVGTPAEVDAALDRLQNEMRVDFVKITDNTLKPDIFLYALKAAKARGLKTSAHIPYALTIWQAADAGLGSIEHLDYLIKAGSRDEAAISADYAAGRISYGDASAKLVEGFDPARAKAAYRRFAAQGLYVTPTLNMTRILAYLDRDDHSHDEALALIGPGLRKTYEWRVERAAKATPEEVARRHAKYELTASLMPLVEEAGLQILAGTDAGYLNSFNYPGQGLHDELARYVEAGLTPAQALRSAVVTGPAFLGQSARYGALAPGKAADILVLDANPLSDIAATRAIRAVVVKGRAYDRTALDTLLADARSAASR
ncbi:amidohydrolase family protein [Sphingomonas sp. MAH-20]|uniref:Amidohydrolase family protein n=2 Tax=Sphingomonadaceae TaxID=41297 RepID=A0A6I4IWM8_9SPHN|nr:amidohydrolase family protein [Sphingomonas horti]MBA2920245.1 amidohydrolase family protein [Sphingomonas sp. CGMCC 1.13658]MVO76499.1 amidohydrolase family protein [Sphingomonas horti]